MRRVDLTEFKRRVSLVHGNKFKVLKFNHTKTSCTIYCNTHEIKFEPFAEHVMHISSKNGSCPECSKEKFKNTKNKNFLKKHLSLIDKKFSGKLKFIGPYISSKDYALYKCSKHGEIRMLPEHVEYNKHPCPKCAIENADRSKLSHNEYVKRIDKKYNGIIRVLGKYSTYKIEIKHECTKHGFFYKTPERMLFSAFGCIKCADEFKQTGAGQRKTHKQLLRELKQVHGKYYPIPLETYINATTKIKWQCRYKHKWITIPDSVLAGHGCPICNKHKPTSTQENELYKWVKRYFKDAIQSERSILGGKEIDIYIPSKKIGIEYNGLYWHSDLHKPNNFHYKKFKTCQDNGVKLIHIYEDDWCLNNKVVKKTLKHIFGITEKRLYARSLKLKKTTNIQLVKDFYNRTHMQGNPNRGVSYALFDDKELVACMTFSNVQSVRGKTNKNAFELIRFATKYSIVGGASKLFSRFIKDNPKLESIISYSDNDLFDGSLYMILGFDLVDETRYDYKVVLPNTLKRLHKSNVRLIRLQKLLGDKFNPNESEKQNCIRNNILRIFDSGKKKWIYNK